MKRNFRRFFAVFSVCFRGFTMIAEIDKILTNFFLDFGFLLIYY